MEAVAETAKTDSALTKRGDFLAGIQTGGDGALSQWDPVGLADAYHVAAVLARSELVPKALRGRTEDTLLVMWHGRELGMSTLQALQHLHVVYGKVGMSADMIRARCQAHPDCELFEILEASREKATLQVRKKGWPKGKTIEVPFTLEDAKQAGLLRGDSNWAKWSEDMCVARATSRAARRYFPAVMAGIYTPEELLDKSLDPTIEAEVVATDGEPAKRPRGKAEAIVAAARAKKAAKEVEEQPEVVDGEVVDEGETAVEAPEAPQEATEAPPAGEGADSPEEEPEAPPEAQEEAPEGDAHLESAMRPEEVDRLVDQCTLYGKREEDLRAWVKRTFGGISLEELPRHRAMDAFAWVATPEPKAKP